MRVVVVYKDETDYARQITDYLRDFKNQTGHDLETLDPESPEGISFMKAYDLWQVPTMIAISNEGQLQNVWQGLPLPTISEVSYYVQ